MIAIEETALVLLAAGWSRRFGGDKLAHPLAGKPLAFHAADTLAALPFATRIVVVAPATALDFEGRGYQVVVNEDEVRDQSSSVRAGVAVAGERPVLLALADMPGVDAALVQALFAASDDAHSVVAASDGSHASPPALFGAGHHASLRNLAGDTGARHLIRAGRRVVTTPERLRDVDRPADLPPVSVRPA